MVTRDELLRAAELIRSGRLVAFPTETVYGLGANALDASAVRRIYEAKGRPSTSPVIVHVASAAMAREVAAVWPEAAEQLAARFWPGPLTLVLPKRAVVPDEVTAGLPTAGIRVPAHPVALALIQAADLPIAAPSANRFTELSPTTAAHVRESLGDRVDCILDGGPAQVGIESTVVSLAGPRPALLRPGMIGRRELEAILGPLAAADAPAGAHPAPGMHRKHYRPRTPLRLAAGPPGPDSAWVWWKLGREGAGSVQMDSEAGAYAARLYDILHELDRQDWMSIVVEEPPSGADWEGIRDRLARAAET